MATNNRDVKMTLGVAVDGTDDVQDLAAQVRELGKSGGAAAPQFERLSGELLQVANETTRTRDVQKQFTAGVNASSAALDANRYALAVLKNETDAAGRKTDEYKAAVKAAERAILDEGQALKVLRAGLKEASNDAKNAAAAQARLETSVRSAITAQVTAQDTLKKGLSSAGDELRKIQTIAGAALGGGIVAGVIKDVAAVADEFKNLQARVRLVTGEGAAFQTAWQGIADVSLRTNSSLADTVNLFTRIAKAGQEAGLSAAVAQQQALALTQTINQAVQLSGSSAEASGAALTQLIQGLQSGVLRGEEFNSVMEQAPRLAQALAQGLGVTTGELRKMAEQGALTASTVITALRSQSTAVADEFQKLPSTVGRALQNLTTQWTLYVGASDNGMASSANAARIIDLLSKNLDTLGSTLYAAGKAWAAIKIAGLAVDLLKWVAGTTAATVAMQANTAALGTNSAAHGVNAAASRASAAASASNAASVTASTARIGAAGSVLGRFSALLGPVGIGLAVLGPELVNIGQWLGEGAAKWVGYGKVMKDAEDRMRLQEEASKAYTAAVQLQNVALEEARNKQFQLSKEAAGTIAKFDELVKKGDSASDAIAKIGKDFDLESVPGIRNAGAVLDKLLADAKITAGEFQATWAAALKGEDLLLFETRARAAFAGATREAERMAAVLDGTAREAIKRTGLDFGLISTGMGAASRSAINDTNAIIEGFDRLKAQGVDVGQALAASLSKSIDTADGQKAIEALTTQIESMRKKLGDKIADGLLDQAKTKATELTAALAATTPGIQSVAEAMKNLGVTSDKSLKDTATAAKASYDFMAASGLASARELTAAFTKYATEAIAANNGVASSGLEIEAAMRGVVITTDEAGKSMVASLANAKKSTEDLTSSLVDLGNAATLGGQKSVDAIEKQITAQERLNDINERAAALERKRLGVDSSGFAANGDGSRIVAGSDLTTMTGLAAFLKTSGVEDDATARNIAREFADAYGNVSTSGSPGQKKYGGKGSTISYALIKAAERYTFGTNGQAAQTPSTIPAQSTTHNVNITLPDGSSGTVNVASANDATTLSSILQQLGTAKKSAN